MDFDKLTQRLIGIFLTELDEHVSALGQNVLALEKATDAGERASLLADLFRTAHSLKGAAGSVSVTPVATACHYLEEMITRLRDSARNPSRSEIELLLEASDAIADVGARLRGGDDLTDAPVASLLPRLEAAAEGKQVPRADFRSAPAAGAAAEKREEASLRPPMQQKEDVAAVAASGRDHAAGAKKTEAADESPSHPRAVEPRTRRAEARAGVTIPADRLDRLLLRGDELLIARQRSTGHLDAVGAAREKLRRATVSLVERDVSEARRQRELLAAVDRDLDLLATMIASDQRFLDQIAAPFQDEVRALRMTSFGVACEGLDRAVRDVAHDGGKEVNVVIRGGELQIDRTVVDALRSPLLQLVRNAVVHGIEKPEERVRAGKPRQGTITVSASLRGGRVHLSVRDDGCGIDVTKLREQAARRGESAPEGDRDLIHLIFEPGFSTAATLTETAGRGIGLDIAKNRIESIAGSIAVHSLPQEGTEFTLVVPLTLTTTRVLLARAAGEIFAIETAAVAAVMRLRVDELRRFEGREVAPFGEDLVPVISLAAILGLDDGAASDTHLAVVVVEAEGRRIGFVVDELVTVEDVLVKSLGRRIIRLRHVFGATLLSNGRLALILNPADLVRSAIAGRARGVSVATRAATPGRKRLIVADDSVTTRALEKSILEAAGFDVTVAADGAEAWRLLQKSGADLVVTDVEMPRMDGFSLTEAIRSSSRFRDLPVILVTALETDAGKERGMAVGANAYLLKSAFDQTRLLETIAELI